LGVLVNDNSRHFLDGSTLPRFRRLRLQGAPIKLSDPFPRRERNTDYVETEPRLFTDDNIYFADDGFAGFADYLTIGDGYSEGGSSPRAVVLHLTYKNDQDNGAIWIRHFWSDSNADTADTPGKFQEAVDKLVRWAMQNGLRNPSIEAFARYAREGSYPGLGMAKKLSIQNHLYVVAGALEQS